MVAVVALLTGVCGGLQKLVVVPHTICADCLLVFSGVFLGLFSVVCLERGVNPNDDIRFILGSSNLWGLISAKIRIHNTFLEGVFFKWRSAKFMFRREYF